MPLFKQTLETPPGPKAKHSATRDASTISALSEVRTLFARLINFLRPYGPEKITSIDGMEYAVLAFPTGKKKVPDGGCTGLTLFVKEDEEDKEVWVTPGTIAEEKPSEMDDIKGMVVASGGSGDVWAEVVISQTTGEIVSVALTGGSDTPDNDDTTYYLTLGHYEFDDKKVNISNYGCGSVWAIICRNWFAAESPFFGCTLSRG